MLEKCSQGPLVKTYACLEGGVLLRMLAWGGDIRALQEKVFRFKYNTLFIVPYFLTAICAYYYKN